VWFGKSRNGLRKGKYRKHMDMLNFNCLRIGIEVKKDVNDLGGNSINSDTISIHAVLIPFLPFFSFEIKCFWIS